MAFKKGHTPTNKGIPQSEEQKRGHSETMKRLYIEGKMISWNIGVPQSDVTRNKISEKAKGRPSGRIGTHLSEETRRKISEIAKQQYASGERIAYGIGKTCTQETRDKISKTKKQRFVSGETTSWNLGGHHTEETKQRISNALIGHKSPMLGAHLSEETKRKISEANRNPTDETRRKMSEARKGITLSEEHKQKFIMAGRIAIKGIPKSDEHRKKIAQTLTGKYIGDKNPFYGRTHSEETLQKMSQSKIGKNTGETNPNWRGGIILKNLRRNIKRRDEFGYIPLNEWEANTPGFVGHHLDREHVLFIPNNLHISIPHRQDNPASMDRINELVMAWYVDYYGLV